MTVFFRPYHDITTAPAPRTSRDEALYSRIEAATGLDITIDKSVDYEDWIEPICMLDAAISAGVEIYILPAIGLREASLNPIAIIEGSKCRDILIGHRLQSDKIAFRYFDFAWPAACDNLTNHYAELKTFFRHAGRKMKLADMPGEKRPQYRKTTAFGSTLNTTYLYDAMVSMGPGGIVVKQVYPIKALPVRSYSIDEETREEDCQNMFTDDIGYHIAHYEGDVGALLVQEKIAMTHETRFFIINGTVVSGAACIEAHTPQQRAKNITGVPATWEVERNSGNFDDRPQDEREDTASLLWDFACQVCEEIRQEAPEFHSYVVDVALGADGKPLIIEFNPASFSGLYANDTSAIFSAILEYSENAPFAGSVPWSPKDLKPKPQSTRNSLHKLLADHK